jgi:hypothetical protein
LCFSYWSPLKDQSSAKREATIVEIAGKFFSNFLSTGLSGKILDSALFLGAFEVEAKVGD